jgi:hypothetical protein
VNASTRCSGTGGWPPFARSALDDEWLASMFMSADTDDALGEWRREDCDESV